MINYRSVKDLNDTIVRHLHKVPRNLDLVVGIPRSGLLAANILALYLNLPITDFDSFIDSKIISTGQRCTIKDQHDFLKERRNVLVLDDSLFTGKQMKHAREVISGASLNHNIYYAAVYITPENQDLVDFYYELVPMPRVFEWNFMHHGDMRKWCLDIDGVLCRDPTDEENDDGKKYIHFLKTVDPLIIPSVPVGWLVTCRLEKYRETTECWLKRHGIKFEGLYMMNLPNKAARVASGSHSSFKASIYKETQAMLFIESSFKQAIEIAKLSGKEVLCIENREMITPSFIAKSVHKKEQFFNLLIRNPKEAFRKGYKFIISSFLKTS